MKIPIIRIPFDAKSKQFLSQSIEEVLNSGMLTQGKNTQRFEELFSKFSGARYCVAVNSATAGLEVILRSLGIEGSSVIVPTNTFLATALAVIHSGNRVIFADSDPETLSLDVKDVEKRIAKDTKAVIVVHIGGIISPAINDLRKLCDKNGIFLIEDCAHAHGCSIDGKQAGNLGIAGAFSFFPTKVLTTGEGGVITTDSEQVYRMACMIRNQGKNPEFGNRISEPGHNFRMSEITAVIGIEQMLKAEAVIKDRQRIATFYDEALKDIPDVRPVKMGNGIESSYYKYVLFLADGINRDQLKKTMKEVYTVSLTGEVYTDLCHEEPIWEKFTYCGKQQKNNVACSSWSTCGCDKKQNGFPGAEYISKHHICLPLYPGMTPEELGHVVDSLKKTLSASKVPS